ncbi:hypothetical protein ACWPKO_11565 [Coraliomargarita sp. W4R53]
MLIILMIPFGLTTAFLAHRKNRNPYAWGILGATWFIVGVIGILFFSDIKTLSKEEAIESKKKEKIFLSIGITIGLLTVVSWFWRPF